MSSPSPSPAVVPISPSLHPLLSSLQSLWTPPSRLPLSQWAEENIILSSEYAARASKLKLFGWQRDIFDSFTDPSVHEIDLYTARQLVKTIFIQCSSAYVVCEDPGPILLLQPDEDAAKSFSRERLAPMIRDCPCLYRKLSDSPHSGNMLLMKEFPGGSLALVGTRSSSSLRRRSVRYLFADEVDAYLASVGTADNREGDPLTIAAESMVTFGSRSKSILASTPTTTGRSRISKAYAASDQRKPYVPCPYCEHYQVLKFFLEKTGGGGVWFDSSLSRDRSPETARYECSNPACRKRWTDQQRKVACERAEWRAAKPFAGIAGFWISQLYSPWISMEKLVAKFLRVKDYRDLYRAFLNTVLAEEWHEDRETPDNELLHARCENYPFGPAAVIPSRGLFLTAAVDVQDSPPRLEVEVKAWGRGRENWSISYEILQVFAQNGQPLPVTSPELWEKLDKEVLQRDWRHESGHTLPIWAMAIDTGSLPKPVYEFARRHPQLGFGPNGIRHHSVRTVIPVKGTADPLRIISSVSKEDMSRKRQGTRIVGVGTICAKQEIYETLLHVRPKPDGSPSPGCYHFPRYDMVYFESLCSEVRVEKDNGKITYEKRTVRNEVLDLAVYNRVAAACVGIDQWTNEKWQRLEASLSPTLVPLTSSSPVILSGGAASVPADPLVPISTATGAREGGGESAPTLSPSLSPAPAPLPPQSPPTPSHPLGPSPRLRPRPVTRGRF